MGLFSLVPFYFEEHNFAKSKILKEAPEDTDNKHQYGVNEKEEIIVVRNYPKLKGITKGQYWEKFYFREENQIIYKRDIETYQAGNKKPLVRY
jgi:hypothetical protein